MTLLRLTWFSLPIIGLLFLFEGARAQNAPNGVDIVGNWSFIKFPGNAGQHIYRLNGTGRLGDSSILMSFQCRGDIGQVSLSPAPPDSGADAIYSETKTVNYRMGNAFVGYHEFSAQANPGESGRELVHGDVQRSTLAVAVGSTSPAYIYIRIGNHKYGISAKGLQIGLSQMPCFRGYMM